jgi:hypothetical protein
MRRRLRGQLANVIALVVIFALGAFAAGYVLLHERLPVPFANTYDVSAALTAADGRRAGARPAGERRRRPGRIDHRRPRRRTGWRC